MHALMVTIGATFFLATSLLAQSGATAVDKAKANVLRAPLKSGISTAKIQRLAVDRAALTVALKSGTAENVTLLDAQGKAVPVKRTVAGELSADVDPRRSYILTRPNPERLPLAKGGIEFPARYLTFGPTGATNLGGLFLRPAVVPLTWNEAARAYATELLVGYEFEDGAEKALAAPKTVTFFAEGSHARIQADTVQIERSGGSGYKRVVLSTGKLEGETYFTARVGPGDELRSSVTVARETGILSLSLPSTELAGYGVGASTLTVAVLGRDGLPLKVTSPLNVQLTGRRLRPDASVVIPAGASEATATVRSLGLGMAEILARTGPVTATLPVQLFFPWAALVAVVIGGAVGGSARYLRNRGKRNALLLRRVIEGVLVAVILVAAVWGGFVMIDVGAGVSGTPFGAFVVAALSGYVGCVLLDRLAKKTFAGV